MRQSLFMAYVRAGLIQFGNFEGDLPIKFYFALLPSFPELLQSTAEALAPMFVVQRPTDRFLTTRTTVALGGVLATLTSMPMLYPLGDQRSYTPAFAIEGTADVSNPVTLLTDVLTDGGEESLLMSYSHRVGLPVKRIVAIIDIGKSEIQAEALFSLEQGLGWVHESDLITTPMRDTVRQWLTVQT